MFVSCPCRETPFGTLCHLTVIQWKATRWQQNLLKPIHHRIHSDEKGSAAVNLCCPLVFKVFWSHLCHVLIEPSMKAVCKYEKNKSPNQLVLGSTHKLIIVYVWNQVKAGWTCFLGFHVKALPVTNQTSFVFLVAYTYHKCFNFFFSFFFDI